MIKKVAASIWFLALIVTIPIIYFVPPVFDKYKMELLSKEQKQYSGNLIYFKDLNNDGKIEKLEAYYTGNDLLSFQCFNDKNRLIDQFNFPHNYHQKLPELFLFDADKDNLVEVYGFTTNEDSIFLNWVEPFDTLHVFHSRYITTVNTKTRENLDIGIEDIEFVDFDKDDNIELVFPIIVGYNLFPRKIFIYHPDSDSLIFTSNFGSYFSSLRFFDYQSDGDMELFCVSSSAKNIPETMDIKYKDDRPRLFVFDKDLNIVFNPIEFPEGLGSLVRPFFINEKNGEILTFYHNFSSQNTMTFLTKFRLDGKSVLSDTIFLNSDVGERIDFYKENGNRFLVINDKGNLKWINSDLKITDSLNLEFTQAHHLIGIYDNYKDEIPEYYFLNADQKQISIYTNHFKNKISLEFNEGLMSPSIITDSDMGEFIINTNDSFYTYRIAKNSYFYLKYPLFVFIYFSVVGFIWILQMARMRQLKEKMELQNQVRDLQLRTLKNQLDPHFIFNTFNTIASVVKQGRNEEAYNIMVRFSKMVRANLDNSNEIYTTLKGELDFVEDYLFIQNFRFKDLFEYKIELEKDLPLDMPIPKLLFQIHVENALIHGIRPAKMPGFISIRGTKKNSNFIIEIEDNGIGREKSKQLKTEGSGIGLKAIQQIIELNNQNSKYKLAQKIIDIFDSDGLSAGTKIEISITKV